MKKVCPHHPDTELEQAIVAGVEVDYCPLDYGLWFDREELRWAKDEKAEGLQWLDADLWERQERFLVSPGRKLCPEHRLPLYRVEYGDSGVTVDVCSLNRGIWLDRGEFKDIIAYLKAKGAHETLEHYGKNLREELWEVFSGPELLREELEDVLSLLKLLRFKFAVQHPELSRFLSYLPR